MWITRYDSTWPIKRTKPQPFCSNDTSDNNNFYISKKYLKTDEKEEVLVWNSFKVSWIDIVEILVKIIELKLTILQRHESESSEIDMY